MSVLTPTPDHARAMLQLAGCAAIFVSSHRVLALYRAASSLRPPPETDEALSRSSSPSEQERTGASATDLNADAEKQIADAELGLGMRSRSGEVPTRTRTSGESRRESVTIAEHGSEHEHDADEADVDRALNDHPASSAPTTSSSASAESALAPAGASAASGPPNPPKAPLSRAAKLRNWGMMAFAIYYLCTTLVGGAYTWGWLPEGAGDVSSLMHWGIALYLTHTYYRDTLQTLLTAPAQARLVHYRPRDARGHVDPNAAPKPGRPYDLKYENPADWVKPWYHTDEVRLGAAFAVSVATLVNAFWGRYEYVAVLGGAVVMAMLRAQWAGSRIMMRVVVYIVMGATSIMTIGLGLLVHFHNPEDKAPEKEIKPLPMSTSLLPIMMAPTFGIPYLLPGMLIMAYHRYEDALRHPQSPSHAPGAPAPIQRYATRDHPRTALLVVALFAWYRLASVGGARALGEGYEPALWWIETVGGTTLVFLLQVGLSVSKGELRQWWLHTEEWYPTKVPDEVEADIEKSAFSDVPLPTQLDEKRSLVR